MEKQLLFAGDTEHVSWASPSLRGSQTDFLPEPSLGEDQSGLQPVWQLEPSVSEDSSEVEPESSVAKDGFRVEETQEHQPENTEAAEVREQVKRRTE
ncbi:UNVERIFIED_CONTAM: hypothetical protein K2H54_008976 [Gekko kuhli]